MIKISMLYWYEINYIDVKKILKKPAGWLEAKNQSDCP